MGLSEIAIEAGIRHLRRSDMVMSALIDQVGPVRLRLERNRFQSLVRAIISQQISGGAARSISLRLQQLLAPDKIAPETLGRLTRHELRQAGISPQKSGYLIDLSQKVLGGQLKLRRLPRLSDEEVIRDLIQVKGIGVWTAQMFLIFSLGRMDVFPHEDLGVRVALRNLYRLDELPDKTRSHKIAEAWRPYATLASWYCWRSLDLARKSQKAAVRGEMK